jgi:hypothetical protein
MDSLDTSCDADLTEATRSARTGGTNKQSYTIPCSSAFRDAVEALAARRKVNVGDIARSVLLVMPAASVVHADDPGEPPPGDRETVILKSGPAKGRPWRRKPRLQVRMAPGFDPITIRRALGLALAMERGDVAVRLDDPNRPPSAPPDPLPEQATAAPPSAAASIPHDVSEEMERMQTVISVLAFEPLPEGVVTRAEALHVLGFAPGIRPDRRAIRARFRMLATIHHPDSRFGSHLRMMEILRDSL